MPSTKDLDAVIAAAKAFGPLAALAEQAGAIKGFEAHLARLKVDCDDMERVREEKAIKLAKVSGELKAEQDRAAAILLELSARHEETVRSNIEILTIQRTEMAQVQNQIQTAITHQVQLVDDAVQAQTAEARARLTALQREIANLTAQLTVLRQEWQGVKAAVQEIPL